MNRPATRVLYTAFALFAVLTLGIVACDAVDRSGTTPEGAVRLDDGEVVKPLARYADGELALLASDTEVRETLMAVGREVIPDVAEVRFEEPVLEVIEGRPLLSMRGTRPDGNCALIYMELGTVREGRVGPVHRLSGDTPLLFETPGGACNGDPCNRCSWVWNGDGFICACTGTGPGGEPGWCNHSTRIAD
ncbi:MAG TPA: hypothetical protein VK002_11165 [Rubricoccaceae bacterium]|nr:hypothetical protein [Rubricoccaceae bacterium]